MFSVVPAPRRDPKTYPHIKIVARPYSYTMDLMFMSSYPAVENDRIVYKTYEKRANNNYIGMLVLIETTSRRLFVYPVRSKQKHEIFTCFQKFLKDVDGKIVSLISDSGAEFNEIRDYNNANHLFSYHQCVAAEGTHTTLSVIDRMIRTLRELMMRYHAEYGDPTWAHVIKDVVNTYNNNKHSALWVYGLTKQKRISRNRLSKPRIKRYYFTPNQVWSLPPLADRLRQKLIKKNKEIYEEMDEKYTDGATVYQASRPPGALQKGARSGYIRNQPRTIQERIGNSFLLDNGEVATYRSLFFPSTVARRVARSRPLNLQRVQRVRNPDHARLDVNVDVDNIIRPRNTNVVTGPRQRRPPSYLNDYDLS